MIDNGLDYFTQFWNYIDIVPPIGVFLLLIVYHIPILPESFVHTIQAITTFALWIKFLYYMRLFKTTNYLIRMTIEVIQDMRPFLIILLITVIAFGDSFLAISNANETE